MIRTACLLSLAVACLAGEDLLPHAPVGEITFHGTLDGERCWARFSPPKSEFGGHHMLELVYAPPSPAVLDGAHLADCPFLLLDDRLRLVAWNGRDTLSQVVNRPAGYRITREEERRTDDGKDDTPTSRNVDVTGPRGWDERVAPVLLALAWHAGSRGAIPCYDLFSQAPALSAVSWEDAKVVISGREYQVIADPAGRLARLDDAAGKPVLSITAWIQPSP